LNHVISNYGASVYIFNGTPIDAFAKLESTYEIDAIYANHDYEPYAIQRDLQIRAFADAHNILFKTFKDQVVYEKAEILKPDGNPYTVFTPYANAWKRSYRENEELSYPSEKLLKNLYKSPPFPFPTLPEL